MCQLVGFGSCQLPVSHASKLLSGYGWQSPNQGGIPWLIQQSSVLMSAKTLLMLETKIFYDTVGLQHFLKQLDQLAGEQRHCAVAVMESTAHYHRILETYLRRSGIDVVVINPLQSGSM